MRPAHIALLAAALALPLATQAQQAPPAEMHHAPATPSTTLTITGLGGKVLKFSVADVQNMQHTTVTIHNPHTKLDETYSGVLLSEFLTRADVPLGEKTKGKLLLATLIAEGTDHYRVVYSLTEVDPANHTGDVLIADKMNDAPLTSDGAFKLICTQDKRPARWVRNLSSITLKAE